MRNEGEIAYRQLDDERELIVYPLTYGRARLVIGSIGQNWFDDSY